ncbi:MAG: hypothetical protein Q9M11_03650 [Mariprofundaceae bacterium]|nr:hypothetical protein [Mariprofundaceae bacterium]
MKSEVTKPQVILDVIYANIKNTYSEAAADAFRANPVFSTANDYSDAVQRGLANRVLINKLLVFRATSKVPVVDAIYCLIPDGNNEDWMNVFKMVILPFLKENKVML